MQVKDFSSQRFSINATASLFSAKKNSLILPSCHTLNIADNMLYKYQGTVHVLLPFNTLIMDALFGAHKFSIMHMKLKQQSRAPALCTFFV